MSRKRYNSETKMGSSSKGQFQSTSPQRSSYEDSLAAECLIRAFLDLGGMEDPILKVLFIGGSKPKQGESDMDLAFKRLKSCWLEKKERSYGMREVLRMKMMEKGIKVDMNPKWARFSVMGAPLIITPKIWINKKGEEKNFLKDFQLEEFKDGQILSETAVRIEKYGYIDTVAQLRLKVIIHRWDQFPEKDPVICGDVYSKRIYHLMVDDLDVLHHVLLHRSQIENMESYYEDTDRNKIQLIQQDWSDYICAARGRKRILVRGERKIEKVQSRSNSNERYNEIFQLLEQKKMDERKDGTPMIEEKMSDAESVRSRQMFRKLKIDPQGGLVIKHRVVVEQELVEIGGIENFFNRINLNLKNQGAKEISLIPGNIFPQGLTSFLEEFGCNNYLKLFIKLSWNFLEKSKQCSEAQYLMERFKGIKENLIKKRGMHEVEENNLNSIGELIRGLPSSVDWLYEGSDIQVFYKEHLRPFIIVVRMEVEQQVKMYWHQIEEDKDKVIWHLIVLNFNPCLYDPFKGLCRISIDDIMTCPLCEHNFSWSEIFKHSCPSGLALDLPKGWPK